MPNRCLCWWALPTSVTFGFTGFRLVIFFKRCDHSVVYLSKNNFLDVKVFYWREFLFFIFTKKKCHQLHNNPNPTCMGVCCSCTMRRSWIYLTEPEIQRAATGSPTFGFTRTPPAASTLQESLPDWFTRRRRWVVVHVSGLICSFKKDLVLFLLFIIVVHDSTIMHHLCDQNKKCTSSSTPNLHLPSTAANNHLFWTQTWRPFPNTDGFIHHDRNKHWRGETKHKSPVKVMNCTSQT